MQLTDETQNKITIVDGHCYDADGVYLYPEKKEQFEVNDQASAEWYGDKLTEMDSEIARLETRIKLYTDNVKAMQADIAKARDGMLYKYGGQLADFAKDNLPKGKKTWTCPTIVVKFRLSRPSIDVTDEDAALTWAKAEQPNAVKVVEKFMKSEADLSEMNAEDLRAAGLKINPGGDETYKIETGVK